MNTSLSPPTAAQVYQNMYHTPLKAPGAPTKSSKKDDTYISHDSDSIESDDNEWCDYHRSFDRSRCAAPIPHKKILWERERLPNTPPSTPLPQATPQTQQVVRIEINIYIDR